MARRLFRLERDDLTSAVARSRNGRRLLAAPDLRDDVAFCLQTDLFDLVTEQSSFGWIERSTQ
jgi:phosphosulfolactate phosphohydrolase-like enzyme